MNNLPTGNSSKLNYAFQKRK